MSEPQSQEPAKLEERLDEAGRLCQPRHPGWETLLARLPAQVAKGPGETAAPSPPAPLPFDFHDRPRRGEGSEGTESRGFRWRTLLATAASIVAVGFALLLSSKLPDTTRPAVAMNVDVQVVRSGVQVTVFNPTISDEPTLFMPLFPAPSPESGYGEAQGYAQALELQQRAMTE